MINFEISNTTNSKINYNNITQMFFKKKFTTVDDSWEVY